MVIRCTRRSAARDLEMFYRKDAKAQRKRKVNKV